MIWPFRRKAAQPSRAAVESIEVGNRELREARAIRRESETMGSAFRQVHEQNHIAAGLEAAIKGRKIA